MKQTNNLPARKIFGNIHINGLISRKNIYISSFVIFMHFFIGCLATIVNDSVQIHVIIYRVTLRAGHQTEEEICP